MLGKNHYIIGRLSAMTSLAKSYALWYDLKMSIYTPSQARTNLYKLIDQAGQNHEPIFITGKRNKVVMLSEEDFNAMQETLYLLSIPGMRESIIKARKEAIEKCSDKLNW